MNNVCINDIPDDVLNNDGYQVDPVVPHTYVFDYYRTIKLIVNNDDAMFNLVNERNRTKYQLPQLYRLQNFELLCFEKLIKDEEYMWIYALKENQKYFESGADSVIDLCNWLRDYKEGVISFNVFQNNLSGLKTMILNQNLEKVSIELMDALIRIASDYSYKREELMKDES